MAISTRGSFVSQVLVDSKGDLFVATADDTVARLAIGADGTILTADSLQSSGISWTAPAPTGFNGFLLSGM